MFLISKTGAPFIFKRFSGRGQCFLEWNIILLAECSVATIVLKFKLVFTKFGIKWMKKTKLFQDTKQNQSNIITLK